MSSEAIVNQMLSDDAFSALLGMQVEQVSPGSAVVSLRIEPSIVNGFQIAHGAIAYQPQFRFPPRNGIANSISRHLIDAMRAP